MSQSPQPPPLAAEPLLEPPAAEESAPSSTGAASAPAESIAEAVEPAPAVEQPAEAAQAEPEPPAQEPSSESAMEEVEVAKPAAAPISGEVVEGADDVSMSIEPQQQQIEPEAQLQRKQQLAQEPQPTPTLEPHPTAPDAAADPSALAAPLDAAAAPPSDSLAPAHAPPAAPPAPTPEIVIVQNVIAPHSAERYNDPTSAASQAALAASQWNGLLHWTRKARGPQWDWATGTYHVPYKSQQYYSNVTPMDMSQPVSALPTYLLSSHSTPLYNQSGLSTPGGASGGGNVTPVAAHGSMAEYHDSGRPRRSRR